MAPKPETKLRIKIIKAIEKEFPEDYVAHPHGSMYGAGMLDLVVCHESLFVSFEIKTPQNKDEGSKLQKAHIARILRAGGVACIIRSPQEALEVLRGL